MSFREDMPLQDVYLTITPSDVTVNARLNPLEKQQHCWSPNPEFDLKHSLLNGGDLLTVQRVDLFEGLPVDQIGEIVAPLNDSQRSFLQTHCRNVPKRFNLCEDLSPAGKTVLAAILCEIRSASNPGAKTLIIASSNGACDALVKIRQLKSLDGQGACAAARA